MVLEWSSLQICRKPTHNKRAYTGIHGCRGAGRWFLFLHQEMGLKVSVGLGRHTWETCSTKSSANVIACWRARSTASQCTLPPAAALPPLCLGTVGCCAHTRVGASLPVVQACSKPCHETCDNARTLSGSPLRSGLFSMVYGAAARNCILEMKLVTFAPSC